MLVPLANVLKAATGGWEAVFLVASLANIAVVLLALLVLRPMRVRGIGLGRLVSRRRG